MRSDQKKIKIIIMNISFPSGAGNEKSASVRIMCSRLTQTNVEGY